MGTVSRLFSLILLAIVLAAAGQGQTSSLSASNLNFATLGTGSTVTAQQVTLNNTGSAALSISSIATSNNDFAQANNCGTSLAAGASCQINVSFTPTTSGVRNGSLILTENASGSPQTVSLAGPITNLAPGTSVTVSSQTTSTGSLGTSAIDTVITGWKGDQSKEWVSLHQLAGAWIRLTWSATTAINEVVLYDRPNLDDNIQAGTLQFSDGTSVNVGTLPNNGTGLPVFFATKNVTWVQFNVSQAVGSNAGLAEFQVYGPTPSVPTVTLSNTSLSFPVTQTGTQSAAQNVTLTNISSVAVNVTSVASTNTDYTASSNCPASLAPSANCTINIAFTPQAAGTRPGSVNVTDNAGNSPQVINLTGQGSTTPPMPTAVLSVSSLNFATLGTGSTVTAQAVTLSNTGNAALAITSIAPSSGDFAQTNNCGTSVAVGASCQINVSFTPTTGGLRTGSLVITDNASPNQQTVSLAGPITNLAPGTTVTVSSQTTSTGSLGTSAIDTVITGWTGDQSKEWVSLHQLAGAWIRLTWSATTAVSEVVLYDRPNLNDNIQAGTLQFSDGTSVNVGTLPNDGTGLPVFFPTKNVTWVQFNVTQAIGSNAGLAEFQVYGPTPTTPTLSASSNSLSFGSQLVGSKSSTQTLYLSNVSSASVLLNGFNVAGDYSQTNNCPSTLLSFNSCSVLITFAPTLSGTRNGSLSVNDNAANQPASVSLTGSAVFGISPRAATVPVTGALQFVSASDVTWLVDGIAGGSATVGTISGSGLYIAPSTVGSHTITASEPTQQATATVYVENAGGVFTYHNDNARTGQNLNETALTTSNVTQATFGRLATYPVDGYVYAQPLYAQNLMMSSGTVNNVVFVATQNDSVYALDADGLSQSPLWKDSFISPVGCNPSNCVTPVPNADVGSTDIVPIIGITGTPVIDPSSKTMYVVAKTKETTNGVGSYVQRLHALDITSGAEKFGGPVVIQASLPTNPGTSTWDPLLENQRPALLLSNGVVYISWGSHGDNGAYHGWLVGYDAQSLTQLYAYNDTLHSYRGGIWQSGAGPATDANGNIYFATGNGGFDGSNTSPPNTDYGDSLLKMNSNLTVADWFTTYNQAFFDNNDIDSGAGAMLVLPDQAGSPLHPHLALNVAKLGTIFLIDRDNLGHFQVGSDSQIVQEIPSVVGNNNNFSHFGPGAYWQGNLYFQGVGDNLKQFTISGAQISTTPAHTAAGSTFGFPGAIPSISANGSSSGIVWTLQVDAFNTPGPAILHAYDATNVSTELYNSSQAGTRDTLGNAVKFTVPTIANGKVIVGTQNSVSIFGLLP